MGSKWDIEKFIGDNDFGLWNVKMEAVLIHQKCEKALKGEGALLVTMSRAEKTEMVDKARIANVLCLMNKVSREVAKYTTATSMWSNFEYLYTTKTLAHRQMVKSKATIELIVEFNKIIGDLENIEVRLEDAGALMVEDIVGCMHLLVEVEYAQLEVELNTPVMVRLWSTLGAIRYVGLQGLFEKAENVPMAEEVKCSWTARTFEKAEDIPMTEGLSRKQGKEQQGVDVKLASSLIWSQGGDCCRSDSIFEFGVQNHVCWKTENRRPIYGVRGPILAACWSSLLRQKSTPNLALYQSKPRDKGG
ncbi:hypothetical protein MTR_4g046673 [Medicago truncatula]|uniref:Uncharacterized protein n=1 Tax=Medicago truncatula TaxID=3880 RepID=A0A072UJM3_MEDTR|nr:hypothetical protein MTR_4g046673 [Medicago truncatula]